MKKITVKPLVHHEQHCYGIYFPYDKELVEVVRAIPNRRYSKTLTCWYIPKEEITIDEIQAAFRDKAEVDTTAFQKKEEKLVKVFTNENKLPVKEPKIKEQMHPIHEQALRMLEQKLILRGYAANTLKTYRHQFKQFLLFYCDVHPMDLEELDIRNYLLYLVEKRKISRTHQNQAINAIKFFYEKVLLQGRKVYYIERPLKERRLPEVLSEEEVLAIFTAVENLKHRVILMLTYSAGLRRGEVLNLRIGDLDLNRNTVLVRSGKGRKDRQSVLAKSLAPIIELYLEQYDPKFWFFEGQHGQRYSETSIRNILHAAVKKAGIKKRVRLHMLRHSFATHLLESGTSTRYIQVLLGHESPVTTELYAQVTRFGLDKINSPLDNIVQNKILKDGKEL